jgi:type VI secretion system protein ImpK
MQEQIIDLVYPVIAFGLEVKDRLARGEKLDLKTEQGHFRGLLQSDLEAKRFPEFGGDGHFLGIRFALVCWLDEIFTLDVAPASPEWWKRAWNEAKLETELYGTTDRYVLFWRQAREARQRPTSDAIEAYFLCVMLGFRGQAVEDPAGLVQWVQEIKGQIKKSLGKPWEGPPGFDPPTNVPPLRGHEQLRRMLITAGVTFLIVLLAIVTKFLMDWSGSASGSSS